MLAALRAYAPPGYPEKLGPVTRALLDRLEEDDEKAILAAAYAELAARTLPAWSLRLYEPARVGWNQDLIVLVMG